MCNDVDMGAESLTTERPRCCEASLLLRLWPLWLRWYYNGFRGPHGLLLLTEKAGPRHVAHSAATVAAAFGQTAGPFLWRKAAAICREIHRPWCGPGRCRSAFCGTARGGLWCMLRRLGAQVMQGGIALQGAAFSVEFIAQSYEGRNSLWFLVNHY